MAVVLSKLLAAVELQMLLLEKGRQEECNGVACVQKSLINTVLFLAPSVFLCTRRRGGCCCESAASASVCVDGLMRNAAL